MIFARKEGCDSGSVVVSGGGGDGNLGSREDVESRGDARFLGAGRVQLEDEEELVAGWLEVDAGREGFDERGEEVE